MLTSNLLQKTLINIRFLNSVSRRVGFFSKLIEKRPVTLFIQNTSIPQGVLAGHSCRVLFVQCFPWYHLLFFSGGTGFDEEDDSPFPLFCS